MFQSHSLVSQGEKVDMNNYRPISVINVVAKAWFKRRILHAPNQILIIVDSNEYVRLI